MPENSKLPAMQKLLSIRFVLATIPKSEDMPYLPHKISTTLEITGALIAWLAVILQFYLILIQMAAPLAETITRFFSFFTIQVNILVACCFSLLAFAPLSRLGRFFSVQRNQTAIAIYIFLVGLVYNLVLRALWKPHGLQKLVDVSLHTIIPLYFLLYWIICVPKNKLRWVDVFPWLVFPFLYLVYTLLRGAIAGFYPYPFIDVDQLGFEKVLINSGWLFFGFLLFSLFFVGFGKIINKGIKISG